MSNRTLLSAVVLALATSFSLAQSAVAQTSTGSGPGSTTTATGGTPTHGKDIDLPIGGPQPGFEEADPPDKPDEDDPPKIYDEEIPTKNEKIVYVLDISGSMSWDNQPYTALDGSHRNGPRIDRAKVELIRSIQSLTKDYEFNVYSFDCDIRQWSGGLQKADPGPKASAISWVSAQQPDGGTGTGPAVAKALRDNRPCLTFVLLSDGAPNCGANSNRGHLQMIINNNAQHAVIHTFGIACYGSFEQFMRDIASTSGGRYYPVP